MDRSEGDQSWEHVVGVGDRKMRGWWDGGGGNGEVMSDGVMGG